MSDDYWSSSDSVSHIALVGNKARISPMYARY
jgi:hypothetical protein